MARDGASFLGRRRNHPKDGHLIPASVLGMEGQVGRSVGSAVTNVSSIFLIKFNRKRNNLHLSFERFEIRSATSWVILSVFMEHYTFNAIAAICLPVKFSIHCIFMSAETEASVSFLGKCQCLTPNHQDISLNSTGFHCWSYHCSLCSNFLKFFCILVFITVLHLTPVFHFISLWPSPPHL